MPGHRTLAALELARQLEQLEGLIRDHDAVFLLTDSRESRWVPTVMGASMNKVCLNISHFDDVSRL
jgi:ubiquitin-like modifier-activating enzyme ATG7